MRSYGQWEQLTMFAEGGPLPVPYEPGWKLVANGDGAQGWHLVSRTNAERGVVTVCGVVGRVVRAEAPAMVPCEICAAA